MIEQQEQPGRIFRTEQYRNDQGHEIEARVPLDGGVIEFFGKGGDIVFYPGIGQAPLNIEFRIDASTIEEAFAAGLATFKVAWPVAVAESRREMAAEAKRIQVAGSLPAGPPLLDQGGRRGMFRS